MPTLIPTESKAAKDKKKNENKKMFCVVCIFCVVLVGCVLVEMGLFFVHTRFIFCSPESFSCIGFLLQTKAWGLVDFLDSYWAELSGRVLVEVSSDVQLVVCMGECTKIFRIRFGGNRFLQHNYTTVLFRVCCCGFAWKSEPCDIIDIQNKVQGVKKKYVICI